MKKYIRLVLLLCICLLGGCGQEKQGPLAFLEESTQEELDAYLLGRTREDLLEEFGESLFSFEPNEDTTEYWDVDETDKIILRVRYDENNIVIKCKVYSKEEGIENIISDEFIIFVLCTGPLCLMLIMVGIPLFLLRHYSLGEKANVFVALGVIVVVLLLPLPAVSEWFWLLAFLTIVYLLVTVILFIWDICKNGFGEYNKATIKLLVIIIVLMVVKTFFCWNTISLW